VAFFRAPPVSSSPPEVSIARLPATAGVLFGREADLAWLDRCWAEGAHVATVVAWGGVGKSALVNRWLATMRDAGWRGAKRVYGWSFYSQGTDRLSSSDELVDAALRWFGDADPTSGSPWDKGERLAALVRKERTILVLDGVEPLQWGPGVQEGKAATQFEEAEGMQKERQPAYPRLYSLGGFGYCDLLLDQGRHAEVQERAAYALAGAEERHLLLDIALNHLSLGRAHLLAVQRGAAGDLAQAASHLAQAVDGLRRAGGQDDLPLGLLARAALRTHTRDFLAARHDLDEALSLATRCGFRLHEADAHLGFALLAVAEQPSDPAPARAHLATARAIVTATGYRRRDGELRELEALSSRHEEEMQRKDAEAQRREKAEQ
jgi:hypothetical protein